MMHDNSATLPTIPAALLRAGYELERDVWRRDLAQIDARLHAQRYIAQAFGRDDAAHIAALVADMELIAAGLGKIEELIAALSGESSNGVEAGN